jgi:hypothetical protein
MVYFSDRARGDAMNEGEINVPVLHDPDPARLLAIARTQPDVILIREPDFKSAMGSQTIRIRKLRLEPGAQCK